MEQIIKQLGSVDLDLVDATLFALAAVRVMMPAPIRALPTKR